MLDEDFVDDVHDTENAFLEDTAIYGDFGAVPTSPAIDTLLVMAVCVSVVIAMSCFAG